MKSEDIMQHNNNRQDAIDKLITFCIDHNFSYNYTDKTFTVTLPTSEPLPTATHLTPPSQRRKKFNTKDWGPTTYHEGDEPDPEQLLSEGEPPEPQL